MIVRSEPIDCCFAVEIVNVGILGVQEVSHFIDCWIIGHGDKGLHRATFSEFRDTVNPAKCPKRSVNPAK
jgi:hypothetical protein